MMNLKHPNIKQFVDYQRWQEASGKARFGFWDYLNAKGNFEMAVAFAKLFWPDFVEVEGHIFLSEMYEEAQFREWQKALQEVSRVEAVVNHLHIYDLFLNNDASAALELELLEYLAQVLLKCWAYALNEQFPDKYFEFTYASEPEEYGPVISFFQK
jgi:hypothetical protein